MKKPFILFLAICSLLSFSCPAAVQDTQIYNQPDFFVRVDQELSEIDLRNSAGSDAYLAGQIPGGEVLHVTDLVYDRDEDTYWVLVSYLGITGWIRLSQTSILRGIASEIPDDSDQGSRDLEVFVSVGEELEILEAPGGETVATVVSDTTPLFFYGEETIADDSGYQWFRVSVQDGESGWVRADQVIMASSQTVLEEKEKIREEERKQQEEETDGAVDTEDQTTKEAEAVPYSAEYIGSFVNYEEGRIITISEDEILNAIHDPETWELISEASYYYVARPAALHPDGASEESRRLIAFNQDDASDVWILFYDPFQPDVIQEEYKTGAKPANESVPFSKAENQ